MQKILNALFKLPILKNYNDIIMYIYKLYLHNKLYKLIKPNVNENDLPFNCKTGLNKIYFIVYQLKYYNLLTYNNQLLISQFMQFYINISHDYDSYEYIININKSLYIYKLLSDKIIK